MGYRKYDKYILKEAGRLTQRANARLRRLKKGKDKGRRRTNEKPKKKLSYADYMKSKAWLCRRLAFYKKYGRVCAACDATTHLHVHHMIYTDYNGNEPDAHLVVLCETHHHEYHAIYGTKKDMVQSTMRYVQSIRAAARF